MTVTEEPVTVDVAITATINGTAYPLAAVGVDRSDSPAQQLAAAFRAIADLLDPPELPRPRPEAPPTNDLER